MSKNNRTRRKKLSATKNIYLIKINSNIALVQIHGLR